MSKILYLLIALSISLNASMLDANDFERDLKTMQSKNPKDLADLKKYLINFNIVEQSVKNGKFVLKVRALQKQKCKSNISSYNVISRSALRIYKDGKAVYDSRGTNISSKKVEGSYNGSWVEHTTVDYTYIDRVDGGNHEYIVSFYKMSDSNGNYSCMIAYKKLRSNPKQLKAQIVKIKNVIAMIRRDIQKAQAKCKKEIEDINKKMNSLTAPSKSQIDEWELYNHQNTKNA